MTSIYYDQADVNVQGRDHMISETLNPNSRLPLYHQLYELLQTRIRSGEWEPGDLIPAESELTTRHGVSRITVRKVLDMLTREGLIVRARGRGTFVAHPKLAHGMTRIVSFTDDMRQRGFTPSTRVLFSGLMPASATIAAALNVPEGEELARIQRLRLADGEPLCVEDSLLVHRHLPGILENDFAAKSLREVKHQMFGILWARAKQTIQAVASPAEIARLLSVKPGAPILYIERVTWSQADIPIEYLRVHYRADRYVLHNELQGGSG
jgi:GntR family transcriptional regulator